MRYVQYSLIGILAAALFACNRNVESVQESTTLGNISIAADESLKPLVKAEVDTFEGLYKYAHINVGYTSEDAAIDLLLKDSIRLAIITRKLKQQESDALKAQVITPREYLIAHEGIAVILNRSRTDTLFAVEQIKEMLAGNLTTWKQINNQNKADSIQIIFDNPASGMVRYLQDTLGVKTLSPQCFAVENNPAVIDYVANNPNAIGLIGASWISDTDHPESNQFLQTIRVAGLLHNGEYYKPYQAYIAQKSYPFTRSVYMVSREARSGLGTGLVSFITSDKGQRVVLKSGLVPATMPVRVVEIKRDKL
jgi:phosphate transport system substrate-binding protein